MRTNKDGSPDKRFKVNKEENKDEVELKEDFKEFDSKEEIKDVVIESDEMPDPNDLVSTFLEENNIKLTFDTMSGFIATETGIKKIDKPTLVIKASYVSN